MSVFLCVCECVFLSVSANVSISEYPSVKVCLLPTKTFGGNKAKQMKKWEKEDWLCWDQGESQGRLHRGVSGSAHCTLAIKDKKTSQLGSPPGTVRGLRLGGGQRGGWSVAWYCHWQREAVTPSTILPFSPCPTTVLTREEGLCGRRLTWLLSSLCRILPGVQAEFVPGP